MRCNSWTARSDLQFSLEKQYVATSEDDVICLEGEQDEEHDLFEDHENNKMQDGTGAFTNLERRNLIKTMEKQMPEELLHLIQMM